MTSAARARRDDPTFYPIEEKVGEDSLQSNIIAEARQLIDYYLVTRGRPTFVGTDQFMYWVQYRPQKCVAPDVYVLPGVPRGGRVKCIKTWEGDPVPSFALEVVSSNDVDKDYKDGPPKYDEFGVKELVIFDPEHTMSPDRLRFQVYRRLRGRGLVLVTATNEERVKSRVLGCWLRAVGEGAKVRLRLAAGEQGEVLLPTELDAASTRAEEERARAEAAEAEIARLRAEIDRLTRKG